MNKNAIKKFAIEARKKLIDSVTDKAGMLGITSDGCSEPIVKGSNFEVYQTSAGTEVTLDENQSLKRRALVHEINKDGFNAVVEKVAYTWFNRICAIRFMEINDYMWPERVRILSSEKKGKLEPDVITQAPNIDWGFSDEEKEEIINLKLSEKPEDADELFRRIFLKQCHLLNKILPELFKADSDYMELLFGISYNDKDGIIYKLVNPEIGIPEEDFLANPYSSIGQIEIIGWLYQYYITSVKNETFADLKKNIKITKERIPAATQLFTPDWIVRYMVENSVGRIWIEHLRTVDPKTDEKAIAENFGWKYYLPEANQEESVNVKLADIRTTYKDLKPTDITCIDPCMGSGHILIVMFDVLMDIYESAGYDKKSAVYEIIEKNIYGLDIDERAYQLAYFSVMMKGRSYDRKFLFKEGIKLHIHQIQESGYTDKKGNKHYSFDKETLDYFVGTDTTLKQSMNNLIDIMLDAHEYGSILKFSNVDFELIFKRLDEVNNEISLYKNSVYKGLYPFISIAYMLSTKYDAVVTNPPYMGASGMGVHLLKYVKDNYPDSKSDLFAVFIEKCGQMIKKNAYQAMITQHTWMFLSSFEKLRNKLQMMDIVNMAHLGPRAFEEIGGEVVQTTSFVIRKNHIKKYKGTYCRLIEPTTQQGKEKLFLQKQNNYDETQEYFKIIPGNVYAYWLGNGFVNIFKKNNVLAEISYPKQGLHTGNNNLYLRLWYEVNYSDIMLQNCSEWNDKYKWAKLNKGGTFRKWFGNTDYVIDWKDNGNRIKNNGKSVGANNISFFKNIIGFTDLTTYKPSFRRYGKGFVYDVSGPSLVNEGSEFSDDYLLGLLNSKIVELAMNVLSPTLHMNQTALSKISFEKPEKEILTKIERISNECVGISKHDWDSFETSWDFKEHPLIRNKMFDDKEVQEDLKHNIYDMNQMSEAYNRWKNECFLHFIELKKNEEELNRIFINIYDLQDELTPEVEDKDITVRKADLNRDIRSFISYAVGCMFGRYSVDEEGLILAGQKFESHFYAVTAPTCGTGVTGAIGLNAPTGEYYYKTEDGIKKCSFSPDGDNCIPITDEEYFADDIVTRFVEFVKTVYGADTLEENLDFIANALGNKGDTSREVIRNYFLKDFYTDHLKVYQKRPIYWLFDSGKQNGFKALIYMHRYDSDTVGRVRTDYLHRAQKYVETAMQSAQYTIDNASSASEKSKATKAVTKYTKQLAEMKIYDEAIAHIANKRIEIDLDDGVKVNYEKFQGVEVAQEGKKALKVDLLAKIK